jgi:hypothetical protein
VTRTRSAYRLLCGEPDTPQAETATGEVITWAARPRKDGAYRLRSSLGDRWDLAERQLLVGLASDGMRDTYRLLHGYARSDYSWFTTQNKVGRRFDHVFATDELNATSCEYLHDIRERGLSDHSALEVEFSPRARSADASALADLAGR